MNRTEVLKLLTFAAAVDKRTVGDEDVMAWHTILASIDYHRAQEAVLSHFRHKPGVWLEPGHVWTLACTRTDGEYEETTARKAALEASQEQPCEQGMHCPRCKAVHLPHQDCQVLVKRPAQHARVVQMFKPKAVTSVAMPHPDVPAEVDASTAAAMEDERRRQLDQLAHLDEENTHAC